jgi:predicted oxidoreductase
MSDNLVSATHRKLGDNIEVGPIGFGCWRLTGTSDADNASLISSALDLGMNLIDNADVYGLDWGGSGFGACEEALGRVLKAEPSLRSRMVLATKGGIIPGVPYNSSQSYLVSACEASLKRMNVDHVDLFQIHRPDMFTHPHEVAEAFSSLKRRGLVSTFGVSNYTVAQTRALSAFVEQPLVSTQVEFSAAALAPMRDGTFDLCMESGIAALAWSPLAGGRIATGEGLPAELVTTLNDLAARENTTRTVIATAFMLAHPVKAVAIMGTQRIDRLQELSRAVSVNLSREDVYRIVVASEGVPLP